MTRLAIPAVFAFLLILLLAAAPTRPARAAEYRAEPVFAPVRNQIVLRDVVWQRSGAALEAGKSNSRPAIVCALLVREVGKLSNFTVAGTPIAPAELEKCNARASR